VLLVQWAQGLFAVLEVKSKIEIDFTYLCVRFSSYVCVMSNFVIYSSSNSFSMIKVGRTRWAGHVAYVGESTNT